MRELLTALQQADSPIGYLSFDKNTEGYWVCSEANKCAHILLEKSDLISKTGTDIFQTSLLEFPNSATLHINDNRWLSAAVMNGSTAYMRIVILTDITAQESRITYLEKKVARLKSSNKDLEHFAYVASHDLREPLRKIIAFSERLNKKYAAVLEGNGLIYLDRMIDATKRMQTFIDDLLLFSRFSRDTSERIHVDLNEILRGVLSDFEMQIDNNKVTIEMDTLPIIKGVKTQMAQLFQNLVGNALKFKNPEVPTRIAIKCIESKDDYQISVSDNGIGFDDADAERVFTLFQRLNGRSEYEGTGIGLAICKKIVENHGGNITAEGKPKEGAVFTIALPK
jgi:light-regulated signal transduction histidine kinase (bacteriophytochrome)